MRQARRTHLRFLPLEDRSVPSAAAPAADYDPDTILVRLKPGAPQVLAAAAPGVVFEWPVALVDGLWAARLAGGLDVPAALAAARANPFVAYAEPSYTLRAALAPNDPKYADGTLWGLHNTGQNSGTPDADIDAPEAWGVTTGGSTTPVAVIDTGVDYRHPDLYLNIWVNPGEVPAGKGFAGGLADTNANGRVDFYDLNSLDPARNVVTDAGGNPVNAGFAADLNGNGRIDLGDLLADPAWENAADEDGNGRADDLGGWNFYANTNDPLDDHDHGTHVAGTIGGIGNNGVGVAGVGWDTPIVPLKFLSASGSGSDAGAIAALDYAVARGVKVSNNSYGSSSYNQAFADAIQGAAAKGHLFVAAAGNGNFFGIPQDNDSSGHYPSNYQPTPDTVIAVAATDRNDKFASFSNYGATSVDLAAPGVAIYSTTRNGGYKTFDGTSMAAPHVAGAAALVWSTDPALSAADVKARLLTGTDPIGHLNPSRPTVTNGRLNAATAVFPGPRLSVSDVTVTEGDTGTVQAVFTVTLSAASTQTVAVTYATADGTATAGSDYTAAAGTLTFDPGVTSQTVAVTAQGDTAPEGNETFTLNLSSPVNALIQDGQGVGTIADDDPPALSVSDVSATEGRRGSKTFSFTVTLSNPSAQPVTVQYATADGTATTADSDYRATTGTLTFDPGQTSKTIAVSVLGDRKREADETFFVTLTGPTNATVLDGQGVGTILNDD